MNADLDQDRRDVGRLQHREARPARRCPCGSLPTLPIWPSTSPPSFRLSLICAVVLMSSSVRSTGLVLGVEVRRRRPGRTAFSRLAIQRAALLVAPCSAEREHRRAARLGVHERIGVDRDEQVGLHAARLLDALVQRHEEVGVARQHRAHVRVRVDAVAQQQRDRERRRPSRAARSARSRPGPRRRGRGRCATTTRRSIFACASCGGGSAGAASVGSGSADGEQRAAPATVAPRCRRCAGSRRRPGR